LKKEYPKRVDMGLRGIRSIENKVECCIPKKKGSHRQTLMSMKSHLHFPMSRDYSLKDAPQHCFLRFISAYQRELFYDFLTKKVFNMSTKSGHKCVNVIYESIYCLLPTAY
jgi:hypothetical protein